MHLGVENMHKVGAIGRPGFDWEYKIVDVNLNPVEKGNPGELMIKGPGGDEGILSQSGGNTKRAD